VLQVSRWDPLKGFPGVLAGFAAVAGDHPDVELVLLGPHVDPRRHHPDNAAVRDGLLARRAGLPRAVRDRVHVWSFAPDAGDREATAVNLVQRRATVVTQNSLREAFGLTVTEAMWKRRTVLGAAVGGIRDQLVDGVNGLLSADTGGGPAWSAQLARALADPAARDRWGRAAHDSVRRSHLAGTAVAIQLDALGWARPGGGAEVSAAAAAERG
jgi:trehalose synthase